MSSSARARRRRPARRPRSPARIASPLRHQHARARWRDPARARCPASGVAAAPASRRRRSRVERLAVALRVLAQEVLRRAAGCPRAARAAAAARISIVFRRKSRSWRKRPAATSARRSALVAEMIRTSTRRVRDEPTRSNSPVSSTRSSLACWLSGTLAISSRNSVPPSASSKRPDAVGLGVGEGALARGRTARSRTRPRRARRR